MRPFCLSGATSTVPFSLFFLFETVQGAIRRVKYLRRYLGSLQILCCFCFVGTKIKFLGQFLN